MWSARRASLHRVRRRSGGCGCSSTAPRGWLGLQPLQPLERLLRADDTDEHVLQRLRSGAQLVDRALGDDSALIADGYAVAQAFHHFEDMRGEKDGCAALHL